MGVKSVQFQTNYTVTQGSVVLEITIGDGQIGSSIVMRDGEIIARGGEKLVVDIGQGRDLANTSINVKSVVSDESDLTDRTSVTYQLRGGQRDERHVVDATVDADGDSVVYRTVIGFVQ